MAWQQQARGDLMTGDMRSQLSEVATLGLLACRLFLWHTSAARLTDVLLAEHWQLGQLTGHWLMRGANQHHSLRRSLHLGLVYVAGAATRQRVVCRAILM